MLRISLDSVQDGDTLTANIVGSSSTIFRSSNDLIYDDPDVENTETELQPTTEGSSEASSENSSESTEQSTGTSGESSSESTEKSTATSSQNASAQ